MPTVREVMTADLRLIERDKRVSAVAGILDQEKIGAAPLVDETGSIVGIVTKSDIVHFEFVGGDPIEARISEIASPHPVTIEADRAASEAAKIMLENQIHHLLVIDGEEVIGIITSMDFVALAAGDKI